MGNEESKNIISKVKCLLDSTWNNRQTDSPKDTAENSQLPPEDLFFKGGSFSYLPYFILNKGLFTRRIYCCYFTTKPATDKLAGFPFRRADMEKIFCSLIIRPGQF